MWLQTLERHKNSITIFQLYIWDLPLNVEESQVYDFFNRLSPTKSIRIFRMRQQNTSSATIRFPNFDTMLTAYFKSYKTEIQGQKIRAKISKNTIIICYNCGQLGHWKADCRKKQKINESKLIQKKKQSNTNRDKSLEKISTSYINQQKSPLQKPQNYAISQNQPFLPSDQKQKIKNFKKSHVQMQFFQFFQDQNDKSEITKYGQQQNQLFSQKQQDMIFAKINSSKNNNFLSHQEEKQYQLLWQSDWFVNFRNQHGGFVKIKRLNDQSSQIF